MSANLDLTRLEYPRAVSKLLGDYDQTKWSAIAAAVNAGATVTSMLGGKVLGSKALTTDGSQVVNSTAWTDVTGLNATIVVPSGLFAVFVAAPLVLLGAAGQQISFSVLDTSPTPRSYLLGVTPGSGTTESFTGFAILPSKYAYTPGDTVSFKVQAQMRAAATSATIYEGALLGSDVSPSLTIVGLG